MASPETTDSGQDAIRLLSRSEVQTEHDKALSEKQRSHWKYRLPRGWRLGVACGSLLAFVVFVLNISTTLWITLRKNEGSDDPPNTLFSGDCSQARQLNTLIHLLINALSTALLSTSNYAMQCMTAPTREEVDKAHKSKRWLDIGVLSMRNLKMISRKRVLLWAILGISSLPLHLFYNSAVYSTVDAYDYWVFSANTAMLAEQNPAEPLGAKLNETNNPRYNAAVVQIAKTLHAKVLANELDRLDNAACIEAYATTFQSSRTNVILVYENATELTRPMPYDAIKSTVWQTMYGRLPDPYRWICGRPEMPDLGTLDASNTSCSALLSQIIPEEWAPFPEGRVSYCLSEATSPRCKLQFSPYIAWTVVAFNLLKVIVLGLVAFAVREQPILTIGDAVASFLSTPDTHTDGLCLMGKKDLRWWICSRSDGYGPSPQPFPGVRERWNNAVSRRRWWFCIALYSLILGTCIGLFCYGLTAGIASVKELMSVGLGELDPRSVISWYLPSTGSSGLLSNVIVANLPQLILSAVYYTYNGIFTTFWLAQECSSYAAERKSLRVSSNQAGIQRTTYFLELPYRFAIPLILISGILHWLCSQSIYLVSVGVDRSMVPIGGETERFDYISCGYSPRAILSVIIIGSLMVVSMLLFGRRQLPSSMPLAGSCSAAISALCHLPPNERYEDAAIHLIRWGVIDDQHKASEGQVVRHCSFSNSEVEEPQTGALYAGLRHRRVASRISVADKVPSERGLK